MRKLAIPAAAFLAIALSSAAFAATAPATAAKPVAATNAKTTDCLKQWKAEKKHTQTRKAFMAACQKA